MKRQKIDSKKKNSKGVILNQVRLAGAIKFPKDFVPWGVGSGTTEDELRELLCDARDQFLDRDAIIILELMDRYSVNDLFVEGLLVLKDK